MSTLVGDKYDLSITISGTEYGFMLQRGQGKPMLSVGYIPNPQLQGASDAEVSSAQYSPDIERVRTQSDFRLGMGEAYYSNPRRYLKAVTADARSLDGVVIGPKETSAATINSVAYTAGDAPHLLNGGMETWEGSLAVGWTKVNTPGSFAKETTVVRGGSASAKWTITTTEKGVEQIISYGQTMSALPQLTLIAYFRATTSFSANGNQGVVAFYSDGVIQASSTINLTSADTWYGATIAWTPSAWSEGTNVSARATMLNTSGTPTGYLDDCSLSISGGTYNTAPAIGTVRDIMQFNDANYLITSTGVWKWNTSTNVWDREVGSPSGGTRGGIYSDGTNDYLFVARATTGRWWYYDKTTWGVNQQVASDDYYADFFLGIGSTLWKALKPNKLSSATAPMLGTYTQVTVGDTVTDITSLINHKASPYVGKENGLFYYNGTSVVEVAEELRSLNNANTGKRQTSWKSKVYMPAGAQALYEYDDANNILAARTPALSLPGVTDYDDRIFAVIGDDLWLYAWVKESANISNLLCGRLETIEGSTSWVWHPIARSSTTAGVVGCAISTVISPSRLWFWTASQIKYLILPDKPSDVTQATGYLFAASGQHYIGKHDFGFRALEKALYQVIIRSSSLGANQTIDVYYKLDDGSWTLLGTANISPSQTLFFPTSAVTKGKEIEFYFDLKTTADTASPKLKSYSAHALLMFQRRVRIQAAIVAADSMRCLDGSTDIRKEFEIAGQLRNAADLGWVLLKLRRETTAGVPEVSSHYIRILSLIDQWGIDKPNSRPERSFSLDAVEVSLS